MEYIDLDEVERLTEHVHKLLDHGTVESAMSFIAGRFGEHKSIQAMRSLDIATRQDESVVAHKSGDDTKIKALQANYSPYWKQEPNDTIHPISSRDVIEVLNFAILQVDIERPEVNKSRLKEKVHALYGKGQEVAAIDQLFCQFGQLVYLGLSDWEIEPTETVLDKLNTNAEHIAEDHDLAKAGTEQLREPLDYIDMVKDSSHAYWDLNEADEFDVERPYPLLIDDVDIMIDDIVDYRIGNDFSQSELRGLVSKWPY